MRGCAPGCGTHGPGGREAAPATTAHPKRLVTMLQGRFGELSPCKRVVVTYLRPARTVNRPSHQ
jgi:hypothetical protein